MLMKRMLVNVAEGEEIRIAITEGNKLIDYVVEYNNASLIESVGNIYKGKVQNIERAIQAAFVDIGLEKNGFLHVSDTLPAYGERWKTGGDKSSDIGNFTAHNRSNKDLAIQNLLRKDQEVLVQITRGQLGNKGPTLSTFLSIPGRYVVLMPNVPKIGVSRKIEDLKARNEILKILEEIVPTKEMGFIARTAAMGQSKASLQADLDYLMKLWRIILQRIQNKQAPALVFEEADVIIRTIRDNFAPDIEEIIIDAEDSYTKVFDFVRAVLPDFKDRVMMYDGLEPLFSKFEIEKEIEQLFDKRVELQSGGFLYIEQTEAMVVIDVNSGKYTKERDSEKLALKINAEAAKEIARQLRLRDLGGLIVNDFIDMKNPENKRIVEQTLRDELRKDKARSKICRTSPLGLIEMTRQRDKESAERTLYKICNQCSGTGWVKSLPVSAVNVLRRIKNALAQGNANGVIVEGNAETIEFLQNKKRRELTEIETKFKKKIELKFNPSFVLPEISYVMSQGRIVKIEEKQPVNFKQI